jgi:hypothetical protein
MSDLIGSATRWLSHWQFAIVVGLVDIAIGAAALYHGAPFNLRYIATIIWGPLLIAVGVWSWRDELRKAAEQTPDDI